MCFQWKRSLPHWRGPETIAIFRWAKERVLRALSIYRRSMGPYHDVSAVWPGMNYVQTVGISRFGRKTDSFCAWSDSDIQCRRGSRCCHGAGCHGGMGRYGTTCALGTEENANSTGRFGRQAGLRGLKSRAVSLGNAQGLRGLKMNLFSLELIYLSPFESVSQLGLVQSPQSLPTNILPAS